MKGETLRRWGPRSVLDSETSGPRPRNMTEQSRGEKPEGAILWSIL